MHFLITDLIGIAAAFVLFIPLALLPGYSLAWLTNILNFRYRSFAFRLAASVPISLSVTPIIGYSIGCWLGLNSVWIVYALLCAGAAKGGRSAAEVFQRLDSRACGRSSR